MQEQVIEIDKRIKYRNGLFIGLLKGLLNSQNEKAPPRSEQQKLIQGGEQMKFRGITIHKRKNCNTWYARHRVNGKQIYVSAKTQQDCYNKLKQLIRKEEQSKLKGLREPKQKEPKAMTFFEWYTKWLELYKKNIKDSTKLAYKSLFNYLESIKNKPINKIESLEVLELLSKIPYERQRQKVYELLNDIMKKAKINKIILDNPLEVIEKPKHKKINGIAFSNEDEIKLEKILINENLDIFLLCLYQGLRRGEALAINVEDIDFTAKTLVIDKAINSKNEVDTTKNTYSDRIIPIFDNTLKVLEKYKGKQGRLFKYTYKQVTTMFEKLVEENFAGKKYTPHSLRHTFITKCQEAGIPLHIIQMWVGHNIGSKVTNTVYTHTRTIAMLENVEKFNNYNKFL